MKTRASRVSLVAAVLVAGASAISASQGMRKSYLVTAIADKGAPVLDLTVSDVAVREGGQPREVVAVQRPPFPLAIAVLVDTTQPPPGMNMLMRDLRAGLAAFVAAVRASSPGSQISLVEVSASATTTAALDAKPEDLDAAVQKIYPAHPSDAVFLEAIGEAARALSARPTPRRAIVTIDFNSSESLNESTMKRMSQDLWESGATVWGVSIRLPRAGGSRREGALNLITKNSGGLRVVANASSGLEALLTQIADSLASQYLVDFARPDASPMKPLEMSTSRGIKIHVTPMHK